ncbi:MAG: adenylyltransferase/cytidyltransferase family protein [Paludibacteraceae bacterium]|nr:adenylyltransferase/cytidyltransferase family protein [Paludibacteraceae bacterium]
MLRILTFGVFDLLHIGHILLFQHIKELQEDAYVVVAVQTDETIKKYKPNCEIVNNTEARMYMVHAVRFVDEVVTYTDVDKDIQHIDFDVFVKGPDQNHAGFQRAVKWCERNGKKVITIPRTEGISSSLLRESYLK